MAYNFLSAQQRLADDPFVNANPSSLQADIGASPLDGPFTTYGSDYLAFDTAADGHDTQDQYVHRSGNVTTHFFHTAATGFGPEACPALSSDHAPRMPGPPHNSHQMTPVFSAHYFPSVQGNLQRQSHWGLASPPVARSYSPPMYTNRLNAGLVAPQNSPSLRQQSNSSQPKSVKHLTCWYWANKGCKLPDHLCLYSHFDTGKLAEPPVQVQRGRKFLPLSFPSNSGLQFQILARNT